MSERLSATLASLLAAGNKLAAAASDMTWATCQNMTERANALDEARRGWNVATFAFQFETAAQERNRALFDEAICALKAEG